MLVFKKDMVKIFNSAIERILLDYFVEKITADNYKLKLTKPLKI